MRVWIREKKGKKIGDWAGGSTWFESSSKKNRPYAMPKEQVCFALI